MEATTTGDRNAEGFEPEMLGDSSQKYWEDSSQKCWGIRARNGGGIQEIQIDPTSLAWLATHSRRARRARPPWESIILRCLIRVERSMHVMRRRFV